MHGDVPYCVGKRIVQRLFESEPHRVAALGAIDLNQSAWRQLAYKHIPAVHVGAPRTFVAVDIDTSNSLNERSCDGRLFVSFSQGRLERVLPRAHVPGWQVESVRELGAVEEQEPSLSIAQEHTGSVMPVVVRFICPPGYFRVDNQSSVTLVSAGQATIHRTVGDSCPSHDIFGLAADAVGMNQTILRRRKR